MSISLLLRYKHGNKKRCALEKITDFIVNHCLISGGRNNHLTFFFVSTTYIQVGIFWHGGVVVCTVASQQEGEDKDLGN